MRLFVCLFFFFFATPAFSQSPEENFAKMGIELLQVSAPVGSYVDVVQVGNLLFLSGKCSRKNLETSQGLIVLIYQYKS